MEYSFDKGIYQKNGLQRIRKPDPSEMLRGAEYHRLAKMYSLSENLLLVLTAVINDRSRQPMS